MNAALQRASVVLPCEPDHFRDFIAGLLGKPQTIARVIDGPFELRRIDVENLFNLVQQRLAAQNEAELIQFTARVTYSDNSSVLLTSYDDFLSYAEVKPLVSVGLALSWTLLVKFRNKNIPERQQVDVRFLTEDSNRPRSRHSRQTTYIEEIAPIYFGYMELRITHTDRTWATDMDSLMAGHLELLRKELIGMRRFTTEHAGKLGWVAFGVAASISAAGIWRATANFSEGMRDLTPTTMAPSRTIEQLGAQIDSLVAFLVAGGWDKYIFFGFAFGLLALMGSALIGIFVGTSADYSRPSFVLLTDKAEQHREAALRRIERGPSKVVLGLIGSIVLSMLATYFFNVIAQTIN